ncbi:epoxide hydrolase [Henriciella barbarensis]|uniref:Epoxide hydrolase n=1 Tax=Henriciella barbarensis TaxID=86342 RepID=A0A399R419_9PROT|nr:epoxide hydrolase family protein [Henriciella barbarensis]RIJ24199.1 epoxide hydrolase [Henriciella barbarensis]
MSKVTPFTVDVSDDVLSRIRSRVEAFRWFPAPSIGDEWAFGMSTAFLTDIQAYWLERYDWRAAEKTLNAWPQFKTEIDGLDIHFLHVVGEAGGKRPLLLTHGWPGSVYEFYEAIGPLAYPSKHGGKAEDAFDLVIPSLPGYGFSGKPAAPTGQQATARMWDTLMRERLGYDTYLAQGGDWGGLVTSLLGLNHGVDSGGGCKAIHLNMIGHQPADRTPRTDEEAKWAAASQAAMQAEGAYLMEQATKPQTLAMALMDSPMGTAAWILEKFHGWSDRSRGKLTDIYSRDQLLTNVMIYLVNDAIATSVWYYAALFLEGGAQLKPDQKVNIPTGIADYPGEAIYRTPPRSWCERIYNVDYWSDMKEGGHFAAMEVPDLYVEDVRAWARAVS